MTKPDLARYEKFGWDYPSVNPLTEDEVRWHVDWAIPTIQFAEADAYTLDGISGDFTACLAAFWWSHIPKSKLPGFLSVLHSKLPPNALVVFVDNRYVEGSSTPVARTDAEGNTYQVRRLEGGQVYEVMNNFPTEDEVRGVLGESASDVQCTTLEYYWIVAY